MKIVTRTERVGEWLGDVHSDWGYQAFYDRYLGQNKDSFDKSIRLFKEMDEALKAGKTTQNARTKRATCTG
jgi:hypothetical protein